MRPTTDPPNDGDPSPRDWLGGRGLVARQETTFANFEVNVGDRRLLTDSESVTLLAVAEGSIRVGNDNVWDSLDADQCGLFVSDRVTMIEGQSGASTHVSLCTVPRSASPLFTGTTGSLSIAHKPMSESIPTLFALGRRLARSESPDDVKLLQVIGDAIFRAFVVEAGVEHVSITPSQAGRAKSYIDDHFAGQIDLTQVAAAVGVRKERLVTIFRQSFGITPMRYLRDRRTHEAVRLVRETSMTLADVAQATGYKNEFHLSREIKRLAGASPRSLRRQKA